MKDGDGEIRDMCEFNEELQGQGPEGSRIWITG